VPRCLGSISPPLLALLATLTSSCVIGRPTRPSLPESAQGPSGQAVTGSPVVPLTTPPDADDPPPAAKPGASWVRGYWHWDGVRYVWERARWEPSAAPAAAP
jgi:hypothetical protein